MCDSNNNCDYEGVMLVADGPKDVYVYCSHTDTEYKIPYRITVHVCPECEEPDWRTLG